MHDLLAINATCGNFQVRGNFQVCGNFQACGNFDVSLMLGVQVCICIRPVTLPFPFTLQTPVNLRVFMDVVPWLWFPGIFLMEVVNGIFGVVKMFNWFLSGILNGLSRLFDQVFELLLRCC